MVLSVDTEDDAHAFWYARVIGVFHTNAVYYGPGSTSAEVQTFDLLWVRWFELDTSSPGGMEQRRLHRLSFIHADDREAFGFLDPKDVVHAAHLIPAFKHGKTKDLLRDSIARSERDEPWDWRYYYVNM